jgi:hypothetical protein
LLQSNSEEIKRISFVKKCEHWDEKHLLTICQEQAKWIDGDEPSSRNFMYQLPHGLAGHRKDRVEQLEREVSNELMRIASNALQEHKLCCYYKARKYDVPGTDAHRHIANIMYWHLL